ncbi:MAG: twin-arginine translocase subunit TatB [Nitrospirae bacterium]|nr:twin-arginine translocase subunit TatB [Nitrospirota bacterium]
MFDLGMQELIVIFAVVLIVFGPQKLPELARSLGKGVAELRKALQGVKDQIDTEVKEVSDPIHKGLSETFERVDFPAKISEKDLQPLKGEAVNRAAGEASADEGAETGRKPE